MTADMLPELLTPRINQKRRHQKTRSGCMTCRSRKVKCGEERPNCLRCVRTGLSCQWPKEKLSSRLAPGVVAILPKVSEPAPHLACRSKRKQFPLLPKRNWSPPLDSNPFKALFQGEEERRYFDTFTSKTAFEILPTFDSDTLRQIVLQACVSDSSIRYAVVALGALDKTAESLTAFGSSSIDDRRQKAALHHRNALRQYDAAIRSMREAAFSKQDIRTSLLACLVIYCFESWDGLKVNAIKQAKTGLDLIDIWRDNQVRGNRNVDIPLQSPDIEDDLVQAFSRLDVQAICFAPDNRSDERYALAWTEEDAILDRMPQVFKSVQEAEIYESTLVKRTMRFLTLKVRLPMPSRPSVMFPVNGWYGATSPSVVATQQAILADIFKWEIAFEPLLSQLKDTNDAHRTIATILSMHMKSIYLALLQVCVVNEEEWDCQQQKFIDIVELAEYAAGLIDVPTSKTPKFQFDSHLVIPLMMVGHKCREPKLRRRAIGLLLRRSRREGVWDSVGAGSCAAFAMQVEEENLQFGKVPGWARIRGVLLQPDRHRPYSGSFTCRQPTGPTSEHFITRRKEFIRRGLIF